MISLMEMIRPLNATTDNSLQHNYVCMYMYNDRPLSFIEFDFNINGIKSGRRAEQISY